MARGVFKMVYRHCILIHSRCMFACLCRSSFCMLHVHALFVRILFNMFIVIMPILVGEHILVIMLDFVPVFVRSSRHSFLILSFQIFLICPLIISWSRISSFSCSCIFSCFIEVAAIISEQTLLARAVPLYLSSVVFAPLAFISSSCRSRPS